MKIELCSHKHKHFSDLYLANDADVNECLLCSLLLLVGTVSLLLFRFGRLLLGLRLRLGFLVSAGHYVLCNTKQYVNREQQRGRTESTCFIYAKCINRHQRTAHATYGEHRESCYGTTDSVTRHIASQPRKIVATREWRFCELTSFRANARSREANRVRPFKTKHSQPLSIVVPYLRDDLEGFSEDRAESGGRRRCCCSP